MQAEIKNRFDSVKALILNESAINEKLISAFIEKFLKENKYTMFIRKVSPEFPDTILQKYIYNYSKDDYEDNDPCVFNIFSILCFWISFSFFLFYICYIFN